MQTLYRTTADLTDDADYGATLVVPSVLYTVPAPRSDYSEALMLQFVLEWIDVALAPVAGRGSFSFQVVNVTKKPNGVDDLVFDSVASGSGVANRGIDIPVLAAGDRVALRLYGMTGPGGATRANVYVRAFQQRGS